jgi:hypothetical protein
VENNKVSLRMQYVGGKIHEHPKIRSKGALNEAGFPKKYASVFLSLTI